MTPVDRTRYCHACGARLAGPLAERTHRCADRPPAMDRPWLARIPARWPAKEVSR